MINLEFPSFDPRWINFGGPILGDEFQVTGNNLEAAFTLKLNRGDGMTLLALNWKDEESSSKWRRHRGRNSFWQGRHDMKG